MIKFRYKRKEPATNGSGSTTNTNSVKSPSNKSVENKSNDSKDKETTATAKHTPLKCEPPKVAVVESTKPPLPPTSQVIKAKTSSEQEYMEDCIRAIVVSVVRN